MNDLPKLIAIVGPTSSGKSALAVKLARCFDGEVISADSRQIYKGLDIGTGKITESEMHGIPHYLLSFVSLPRQYSVALYKKAADGAIRKILDKNKLPILVGGTGLYIDAVTRGIYFPDVPPDSKLRKKLEKRNAKMLLAILEKLDSARASKIDPQNRRRIIRAIEIAKVLPRTPKKSVQPNYDTLFLGIRRSPVELRKRIKNSVHDRIQRGLIQETKKLLKSGLSKKRLAEIGLDYRFAIEALGGRLSRQELIEKLETASRQYAKRQHTWFKRYKDIHWFKNEKEAKQLVLQFL
ncbi:MAG: tRNA (adenosine(37)-N6)-dimethylallyltransferase MiaA [Candidatus Sungbacteria bacterium]|uniref:tRNA dimethylallyltransferase n=1 Tax=Candidatus Sungiibacteriota bacterium TaxID=2750080 RepID=A0A9D6QTT0_9BACT|nr:tRNA (adenosine(37)-N6)-dimethylallyltransferase MiaA [Candidatus Sungbacteria bacterium]